MFANYPKQCTARHLSADMRALTPIGVSKKTSNYTYLYTPPKSAAMTPNDVSKIIINTLKLLSDTGAMTPVGVINLGWYNIIPTMVMQLLVIPAQANFPKILKNMCFGYNQVLY